MTCIIAVKDGRGGVLMGADSAVTTGDTIQPLVAPKIVRIGDVLIGGAGRLLHIQRILTRFVPPPQSRKQKDPYVYMVQQFVPALGEARMGGPSTDENGRKKRQSASTRRVRPTAIAHQHDHHRFDDDDDDDDGFIQMIVAYRGRIFTVSPDGAVVETAKGYASIGSGAPYAVAALVGLEHAGVIGLSARERVEIALRTAAEVSSSVAAPFIYLHSKKK